MRVEEYERHFKKMMRYAPDDTNTNQKKQFWFLRGLHHGLHQGLKVSEHKSLHHLVNRVIAIEDERRGHEERLKGEKRTGDRDHHDRSFQKLRSGQINMLRGSYLPRHNQPGRSFRGGGRSPFRREEPRLPPTDWRLHPCAVKHRETCRRNLHHHLLRLWQAWSQVLRVPRQEDCFYARESTFFKRPTSGCNTTDCRPWEAEPPHQGGGC
jgi:hypothetical protein